MIGCAWCITSTKRSEMRYALGLKEEACCCCTPSCCGDELMHFFCMPCALVEERKVLEANGEAYLSAVSASDSPT